MKRYLLSVLIGVGAMVVLSGCNPAEDTQSYIEQDVSKVSMDSLRNGYKISGFEAFHQKNFELKFCENGRYRYIRGDDVFHGIFGVSNTYYEVNFNDDAGKPGVNYVMILESDNGYIELNHSYDFRGIDDELHVERIVESYGGCD